MIILTRTVDCPKGKAGSKSNLGGFIRPANTRVFPIGIALTLGIPYSEIVVDYGAATISWNGSIVATMISTGTMRD